MASRVSTSDFRTCLRKISKVLTEKNVKDITFLCEDIRPARKQLISTAGDLFVALQGLDLLHERKTDVLIDLLDYLQLEEASQLMKEYKMPHLQVPEKFAVRCQNHNDQNVKHFCTSCNSKMCDICTHNAAAGCNVISIDHISEELSKRRETLTKETDAAIESIRRNEKLLEERDAFFSKCREDIRSKISKDASALIGEIDIRKRKLVQKLNDKEKYATTQMIETKKYITILCDEIRRLAMFDISPENNAVDKLSDKINNLMKETRVIEAKIMFQKEALRKNSDDISYEKMVNTGTFSSIEEVIPLESAKR